MSVKSQKSWQESDGYLDDDAQIEKVLRIMSKGLVEIKKVYSGGSATRRRTQDSRIVQFIHESVRDFLLHHDGLQLIDRELVTCYR